MKFLVENWYVIVALLAVMECIIYAVYGFLKLPTRAQVEKVRAWLLWAVTNAEKELGGGTGKLKLRQVYDLFVQRFPAVAMAVSFDTFSQWVDDALTEMRKMLVENKAAAELVMGDGQNG